MKVLMRDESLRHRGVLPVLEGTAVLRNNNFSTWKLTVDGNNPRSRRFQPGWGITVFDTEDNQILSGPAVEIEEVVSGDNRTRTLNISGVSDDIYLADSLVIPNPPAGATAQSDLWKTSGKAETVMRKLVNDQIGPNAPADYKVPLLRLEADKGRGANVSVSERFTNILDVLQEQATSGNLLFRVVQDGQVLKFQISEPRDRTRAVRLTRQNGTVGEYRSKRTAPDATEVIVGGVGSGATRKMWRVANPVGEWGRRVTKFVDRQSTSDSNELQQAAETELENKGEEASVTFDANEIQRLKYGRSYMVGDKITVNLSEEANNDTDAKIQDTVQVAELSWNANGRDLKLQVGPVADESVLNKASGELLDLYKRVWAEIRRNQTR